MAPGFHPLLFAIQNDGVAAHIVSVLPHPSSTRVDCPTRVVTYLGAIAGDVHRTLHLAKRRRAVGLFLAVVSGLHFAPADRDVGLVIRIDFDCLRSRARVPDGWI